MRQILYAGFCVCFFLTPGCVAISWPCITDSGGNGRFTVNTNGKAHIIECVQSSLTNAGRRFERVSFVDQSGSGYQTVTAYDVEVAAHTSNFHSDTYCNPDWTGCAWFTN